jgi:hypothetical protein
MTSSSVEEKEKSPSPSPRSPVGSTSGGSTSGGVVASAPRSLFAGGMEDSDSDEEDNNSHLVEKLRQLNQEQSAAQAALITQTLLRYRTVPNVPYLTVPYRPVLYNI